MYAFLTCLHFVHRALTQCSCVWVYYPLIDVPILNWMETAEVNTQVNLSVSTSVLVVMTHNDKAKGTYVCMNRVFRKMTILQPRAEHRVCVSTKRYIGEKRKRVIPASPGCFLAGWLKAAEDNDTGQRTTNYLWRKKEKQNHHNDPAAWEFEM